MIAVSWGSATERGPRRNNQDAFLAEPPAFVVADGMGGHAGGELASAIVVETFRSLVGRGAVPPAAVSELIGQANEAILQQADVDPTLRGMGTTLVALVMVNEGRSDYWLVANVGDSRLYRLAEGELRQLTVDHSFVQELVDAGRIRADEARTHPQRNIVTRVLGSSEPPEAEYWLFAPEAGERYLLCSDGLCGELYEDDIARLMAGIADPGQAAVALVRDALAAGGTDNATAIVIDVREVDRTEPGLRAPLSAAAPVPAPFPDPRSTTAPNFTGSSATGPNFTGVSSTGVSAPGPDAAPNSEVDRLRRARGAHRIDRTGELDR